MKAANEPPNPGMRLRAFVLLWSPCVGLSVGVGFVHVRWRIWDKHTTNPWAHTFRVCLLDGFVLQHSLVEYKCIIDLSNYHWTRLEPRRIQADPNFDRIQGTPKIECIHIVEHTDCLYLCNLRAEFHSGNKPICDEICVTVHRVVIRIVIGFGIVKFATAPNAFLMIRDSNESYGHLARSSSYGVRHEHQANASFLSWFRYAQFGITSKPNNRP